MAVRGEGAWGLVALSIAIAASRCTCVAPTGFELLPPPPPIEDVGFEPIDVGFEPIDTGMRDGGMRRDAGRRDAGPPPDSGVIIPDAGFIPDSGCEPALEVTPTAVSFATVSGQAPITVRNVGCGVLEVTYTEIVPQQNFDFFMPNCIPECFRAFRLCNPIRLGCRESEATFEVRYENQDRSLTDSATLEITSTDPVNPIQTVQLSAERVCAPPVPTIGLGTIDPIVGVPVVLDGSMSNTGGSDIMMTIWQWYFVSQPGGAIFSQQGQEVTSFLPFSPGVYVIGLHTVNDCNLPNASDAFITLNVREPP